MTSHSRYDRLLRVLTHEIFPDGYHRGVPVHAWHVEVHQNEIETRVILIVLFKVILDHLESLVA